MDGFSNSEIDRLGSRLRRTGSPSANDVSMYVSWSASFEDSLHEIQGAVLEAAQRADVDPSERTARIKQLYSTIAKLKRMPTKLSRLDDIAGCRIVVGSEQDINSLVLQLATSNVKRVRDYRHRDRNGYRAVHLTLLSAAGRSVEVQLRTELQHVWAGVCERRAAVVDHAVKYGGGPASEQVLLKELSRTGRTLDLRQEESLQGASELDWPKNVPV